MKCENNFHLVIKFSLIFYWLEHKDIISQALIVWISCAVDFCIYAFLYKGIREVSEGEKYFKSITLFDKDNNNNPNIEQLRRCQPLLEDDICDLVCRNGTILLPLYIKGKSCCSGITTGNFCDKPLHLVGDVRVQDTTQEGCRFYARSRSGKCCWRIWKNCVKCRDDIATNNVVHLTA